MTHYTTAIFAFTLALLTACGNSTTTNSAGGKSSADAFQSQKQPLTVIYLKSYAGQNSDGSQAASRADRLDSDGTITTEFCLNGSCTSQHGKMPAADLAKFRNLITQASSGVLTKLDTKPQCPPDMQNTYVESYTIEANSGQVQLENYVGMCPGLYYENNSPATEQIKSLFQYWLCGTTTCGH